MIEQELKNIWKSASKTEQIKLDLSKLMIELNNRLNTIEHSIKQRDRREIGAALLGIPLHLYFFYLVPYPITRIGLVFTILWFVYVIYKLKAAQKVSQETDNSSTYINQLKQQKKYLKAQAKLLDTVLFWYLLPPFIGNIICIMGAGNPADYDADNWILRFLPVEMSDKLSTIAFLAVFFAFVYWLNRRASKKTIKPIIQDIKQIETELEM